MADTNRMKCDIGSIGRDCAEYLGRYFRQCAALAEHVDLAVHLVIGDSSDDSLEIASGLVLKMSRPGLEFDVIEYNHGGPKFGSVVNERRWWQISLCCNQALKSIRSDADIFIWVESDLIWDDITMLSLIGGLDETRRVIAPLCLNLQSGGTIFYDVWGFRKDGQMFSPVRPFCKDWASSRYIQIDSAGSCLVMWANIARNTRFQETISGNEGIVGWCRSISKMAKIWMDSEAVIWHP